jgi:glyoxylase-like metal-dependent hydrolase (beta-lactamase superfamily II)
VDQPVNSAFQPVITHVEVPPGILGPDPARLEVRCFIVQRPDGVVLVDAGPPSTGNEIGAALGQIGASWSDVSDIVLTHAHFDHVGGLDEVAEHAPRAVVWAGPPDLSEIRLDGRALEPLMEGDRLRDLLVLETPGHTPGHLSLLDEANSLILVGDAVGNVGGALSFGPPAFIADPEQARASLERLASIDVERFVFSHGAEVNDPRPAIGHLLGSPG